MGDYVNLYYLHWWTLTYFLFQYEDGKYRDGAFQLIRAGGSLEDFEKHIGPIEQIQSEWYCYIRQLKKTI